MDNIGQNNLIDNSPYWTKQRRELARWFNDQVPSFTHAYVGAVRLLHMPDFPGRVHFICHVVRDIYRHLPAVLGTNSKMKPRPSEVYPELVKDLAGKWKKFPPKSELLSERRDSNYSISPQVHRSVEKLVDKCNEMSDYPSIENQLANALSSLVDRWENEFTPQWILKAFKEEYNFFVGRAHLARSLAAVPTDDGLIEHFEAFERAFHSLVGPYFSGKEELDAILQDTNATTD